eukprot:4790832-Prymnesium_polylepis.1
MMSSPVAGGCWRRCSLRGACKTLVNESKSERPRDAQTSDLSAQTSLLSLWLSDSDQCREGHVFVD